MSIDISLILKTPITKKGTSVFICENGKNKELTVEKVRTAGVCIFTFFLVYNHI